MKTFHNRLFRHLYRGFFYSLAGLKAAWQSQFSFRIEVVLTVGVFILALFIAKSIAQFLGLIGSWIFVLVVECLNSAIEAVVDRISSEIHPLSKRAKDFGSAAVFLACCVAAIVWLSILFL